MTNTDVAVIRNPRHTAANLPAKKVKGRLKRALELMIWDNKTDNEAAVEAGLTVQAIRLALTRPYVRTFVRETREVLRTRELGRNIHTLIEVRDQTSNQMARVTAVKALELIDDEEQSRSASRSAPGVTINILTTPALTTEQREIEAKPLIQHEDVRQIEADNDE